MFNVKDIKGIINNNPSVYSEYFDDILEDSNIDPIYQIHGIKNENIGKLVKVGNMNKNSKILLNHFNIKKNYEVKMLNCLITIEDIKDINYYPMIIANIFKKKSKKKLKELFSIGIFFNLEGDINDFISNKEGNGYYSIEFIKDGKIKQIERLEKFPGNNNLSKILYYMVSSKFIDNLLKDINIV